MIAIIIGFAVLFTVPTESVWSRSLIWGGAATLVIGGSVAIDRAVGHHTPSWLVKIGEASYSLYLSHTFVLPVVGAVAMALGLHGNATAPVVLAGCIIGSISVAVVLYRFVELPMTRGIKRILTDRAPIVLNAPETPLPQMAEPAATRQ